MLLLFRCVSFHSVFFDVRKMRSVTHRQRHYAKKSQGWRAQSGLRAPEWQCAACKTRSFLRGHVPSRSCCKQREETHDECINEWSPTAAWRQRRRQRVQRSHSAPCEHAERGSPSSCIGSAATDAGKSIGDTRRMRPNFGEQGAAGGDCDKTVSTPGTMDQGRDRCRLVVETGDKAMEAVQKAQETFDQAQQKVVQAQMDLDKLMQEAPLPVNPVPQVNGSLVQTLEALTGECLWNPDVRQIATVSLRVQRLLSLFVQRWQWCFTALLAV